MVVLDSDIMIGILRDDTEAIKFMNKLDTTEERLNTTVINTYELFHGAILHPKQKDVLDKVNHLLRSCNILSFFPEPSFLSAEISADLRKKGNIIDFQDIAIASIAISNGEKLVTRNIRDFSRIKGLKTEKW